MLCSDADVVLIICGVSEPVWLQSSYQFSPGLMWWCGGRYKIFVFSLKKKKRKERFVFSP
jgi:hypothetical protein